MADQTAFPRASHTGHGGKDPLGNGHCHVLQIIQDRMFDLIPLGPGTGMGIDDILLPKGGRRQCTAVPQILYRSLVHNHSSLLTGIRSQFDHMIRQLQDLQAVLHHQDGVVLISEFQQQISNAFGVRRMQTGCGLIEDIGDIAETAPKMPHHFQPLRLAAGKRVRSSG